jgi:hypothetical protein
MEMQNTEMGQDAAHDPSATTQQQDVQISTLSNLAQLISGAAPENPVDLGAQHAAEAHVAAQNQGKLTNLQFLIFRMKACRDESCFFLPSLGALFFKVLFIF